MLLLLFEKIVDFYQLKEDSMIRKLKGGSYRVLSQKGKNMGTYKTKGEAKERLKNIEMFKHMKSKADDPKNPVRQNLDLGERERVLKRKNKLREISKMSSKTFDIPANFKQQMLDRRASLIGSLSRLRRVLIHQGFITEEQAKFLKQALDKSQRFSKIAKDLNHKESLHQNIVDAFGGEEFLIWLRGQR
jgi:hypothetical protein